LEILQLLRMSKKGVLPLSWSGIFLKATLPSLK
jgi:hypothetical protein